jgi:hypothetical protein
MRATAPLRKLGCGAANGGEASEGGFWVAMAQSIELILSCIVAVIRT